MFADPSLFEAIADDMRQEDREPAWHCEDMESQILRARRGLNNVDSSQVIVSLAS